MSGAVDEDLELVMQLRRATGKRMLAGAFAIAAPAIWWIRKGLAEQGDPMLIWAPSIIALLIASCVAIAGVVHLAKPPKLPA